MSSDEINQDEYAQDAQNKEMLLEIFYKTKGLFYTLIQWSWWESNPRPVCL